MGQHKKRQFLVTMLAVVNAENENRAAELGWAAARDLKAVSPEIADLVVKEVA